VIQPYIHIHRKDGIVNRVVIEREGSKIDLPVTEVNVNLVNHTPGVVTLSCVGMRCRFYEDDSA
jgi:hypothetical protein